MTDYQVVHFPVSVKGIVFINHQVLLLRNERDEWELPGGKLERHETPETCVVREISEETGLQVAVARLVDCWVYPVNGAEVLIVTYLMALVGRQIDDIVISHEHKEAGLFNLADIAGLNMPAGYKHAIFKSGE